LQILDDGENTAVCRWFIQSDKCSARRPFFWRTG